MCLHDLKSNQQKPSFTGDKNTSPIHAMEACLIYRIKHVCDSHNPPQRYLLTETNLLHHRDGGSDRWWTLNPRVVGLNHVGTTNADYHVCVLEQLFFITQEYTWVPVWAVMAYVCDWNAMSLRWLSNDNTRSTNQGVILVNIL